MSDIRGMEERIFRSRKRIGGTPPPCSCGDYGWNNFAERGLRPSAIARKISFGSQSNQGMRTREIFITFLHTASIRGLDPDNFLEKALNLLRANPQADLLPLLGF